MPASPDERHFFGAILEGLGMANTPLLRSRAWRCG
nr:hypothetical protein [Bradyrhizobium sp. CIR48]